MIGVALACACDRGTHPTTNPCPQVQVRRHSSHNTLCPELVSRRAPARPPTPDAHPFPVRARARLVFSTIDAHPQRLAAPTPAHPGASLRSCCGPGSSLRSVTTTTPPLFTPYSHSIHTYSPHSHPFTPTAYSHPFHILFTPYSHPIHILSVPTHRPLCRVDSLEKSLSYSHPIQTRITPDSHPIHPLFTPFYTIFTPYPHPIHRPLRRVDRLTREDPLRRGVWLAVRRLCLRRRPTHAVHTHVQVQGALPLTPPCTPVAHTRSHLHAAGVSDVGTDAPCTPTFFKYRASRFPFPPLIYAPRPLHTLPSSPPRIPTPRPHPATSGQV